VRDGYVVQRLRFSGKTADRRRRREQCGANCELGTLVLSGEIVCCGSGHPQEDFFELAWVVIKEWTGTGRLLTATNGGVVIRKRQAADSEEWLFE